MNKVLSLIVLCVGLTSIAADVNVERDANLTTPQIIAAYGYKVEVHEVTTEDGYILELHRIPGTGKQPVLFVHGILDSSSAWILTGPGKALGYIISDLGYDVWLINVRGNTYSKKHVKFDRYGIYIQKQKYWDFSWHEIGKFDLPATIDFIIKTTGFEKVHYIGHSQGETAYHVMASERPEYNDKILFNVALAPPIYMGNSSHPLVQMAVQNLDLLQAMAKIMGINEVNRKSIESALSMRGSVCVTPDMKDSPLCTSDIASAFVLIQTSHLDPKLLPLVKAHLPSTASIKQLAHYGQLVRSNRFCQFDNGEVANKRIYGTATPPAYNLKASTAPTALFYGDADVIVNPKDVFRTHAELTNQAELIRVNDDIFNHYDFIVANNAKELVYDQVIELMRNAQGAP